MLTAENVLFGFTNLEGREGYIGDTGRKRKLGRSRRRWEVNIIRMLRT
jgi:hypothetical protein